MVPFHGFERDPLGCLGNTEDLARILAGEEPFGDQHEQKDGRHEDQTRDDEGRAAVLQNDLEAFFIPLEHPSEKSLRYIVQSTVMPRMPGTKKTAAKHGGEGQRNKARHQNGDAYGHGKFMEQSSNDPAHEENGDEDRNE